MEINLKEMRFRVNSHLYRRYKVVCAQMDISIPKQTAELIRKFVEVQEDNERLMQAIKDLKKIEKDLN